MEQVILITGASSGFGELTAKVLAKSCHIVYASMRDTAGESAAKVQEYASFATENKLDLLTTELDVSKQESVDKR